MSRRNLLFVICCLLLSLIVAVLTSWAKSYLWIAKYDYDSIRKNEKIDWGGPKEGKKIELNKFRTEQGESFPEFPEKSLILLSLSDPRCEMCRLSADLIEQVESEAKLHKVNFFMVSVVSDIPTEEFFRYARKLHESEKTYLWQSEKELILPALQKMVVPSHLLINEKGIVLRRFPGSSRDKTIRVQMANQIIAETLAEKAGLD